MKPPYRFIFTILLKLIVETDSISLITTSSEYTIEILDQCLLYMEERYLRCFYGEPWCFLTMCAAIMLIRIHLRKETWETAKSSCAQRFLGLYHKHIGKYQLSLPSQRNLTSQDMAGQIDVSTTANLLAKKCWLCQGVFIASWFIYHFRIVV
jgi:hypothetical protein